MEDVEVDEEKEEDLAKNKNVVTLDDIMNLDNDETD